MPERVRTAVLRDTAALASAAEVWRALWSADAAATPFQTPEWLLPWWRQFGQPQARVAIVFDSQRPLALLPFYVYKEPETGERKLMLIGVGTTDYLDGVFAPGCTVEHVLQGLEAIRAEGGWDTLVATQMRAGSLLLRALEEMAGGEAQRFAGESCCEIPASPIAGLPRSIRRNAMYYRNRALREGELLYRIADKADCLAMFEEFHQMHTRRWQQRGEPGVLAEERVLAWHRDALPCLAMRGMLRLGCLSLAGETLGMLYSVVDPPGRPRRRQYVYLPAFSTERADLRPGTLLLAYAVEYAAGEGVEVIDMLRGEEEYKQLWHAERVPTFGLMWPQAEVRR